MLAALYSYISRNSSARVMTETDGRVCHHEAAVPGDAQQQDAHAHASSRGASKRKASGA